MILDGSEEISSGQWKSNGVGGRCRIIVGADGSCMSLRFVLIVSVGNVCDGGGYSGGGGVGNLGSGGVCGGDGSGLVSGGFVGGGGMADLTAAWTSVAVARNFRSDGFGTDLAEIC